MDFNDTPEEAAFRKEVRAWLDANATRKSDDTQSNRARNDDPELLAKAKAWQDKKAAAGYARMTWPKEFGGRGASPILQVIYQQEESNYLVPLGFFDIGLGMCIPTMMAYATPEQLKRYVKLELARSNAYYGAMMLTEDGADLPLAAAAARIAATDAYDFAAKENIQTHGGIGFTWEADTQFHYRRSRLLALSIGGPMAWKDKLVTRLEQKNAA